jgi:hypothetical protein
MYYLNFQQKFVFFNRFQQKNVKIEKNLNIIYDENRISRFFFEIQKI